LASPIGVFDLITACQLRYFEAGQSVNVYRMQQIDLLKYQRRNALYCTGAAVNHQRLTGNKIGCLGTEK